MAVKLSDLLIKTFHDWILLELDKGEDITWDEVVKPLERLFNKTIKVTTIRVINGDLLDKISKFLKTPDLKNLRHALPIPDKSTKTLAEKNKRGVIESILDLSTRRRLSENQIKTLEKSKNQLLRFIPNTGVSRLLTIIRDRGRNAFMIGDYSLMDKLSVTKEADLLLAKENLHADQINYDVKITDPYLHTDNENSFIKILIESKSDEILFKDLYFYILLKKFYVMWNKTIKNYKKMFAFYEASYAELDDNYHYNYFNLDEYDELKSNELTIEFMENDDDAVLVPRIGKKHYYNDPTKEPILLTDIKKMASYINGNIKSAFVRSLFVKYYNDLYAIFKSCETSGHSELYKIYNEDLQKALAQSPISSSSSSRSSRSS